MKEPSISRQDSNSMRGVAILFIMIHNLAHLISTIEENEYVFSNDLYPKFINSLLTISDTLLLDIFSFLGWYGIVTFLFLSGYGLVKKHEKDENTDKISFIQFIKPNILKLFKLLIIPYLTFIFIEFLLYGGLISYSNVIKQLCFVSNLWPSEINPGVYWFFGLMLQLYAFYYIFMYKEKNIKYIILNLISLCLIILCVYNERWSVLYFIRYQFIGWILPFTLGVLYARYNVSIVFNTYWKNLLMFIVGSFLLIYSNSNGYIWIFSPIIVICLALYLCELMKKIKYTNKIFVYLGSVSAFIFAIHPVVRHLYYKFSSGDNLVDTLCFVFVSLIFSVVYKWIHNSLYSSKS